MRFSKRFKGFEDWFAVQDRHTGYIRRITRLHNSYPKANLEQLRGHARIRATPKPVYKRSWNTLSSREQLARERALEVLSKARRSNQSLSRLSREHGISAKAVLRATRAFDKVKGRWKPSKHDRVSRALLIYENGREVFIEVTNSKYASLIGRYHSAIKEYLENGNLEALKEFKGKMVRDREGNYHILETDPDAIRAIAERKETEFNETIYEGVTT